MQVFWDWTLATVILYNIIMIPVTVGFGFSRDEVDLMNKLEWVTDGFICADVLMNFRVAVHVKAHGRNLLVGDSATVVNTYLRGWFFVDLLAIGLPFQTHHALNEVRGDTGQVHHVSAFFLLSLLKLLRFSRFYRAISRRFHVSVKAERWASISSLVLFFIYLCHTVGSIFHFIGLMHVLEDDRNWIVDSGLQDSTNFERYGYALYCKFMTQKKGERCP